MKRLQTIGLLIAVMLIYLHDLFDLVVDRTSFGNPLVDITGPETLTLLFWSTVVFIFFFFRFHEWAEEPPIEFSKTPPRHCTTSSRYFFAQFWYAVSMLTVFFVLVFVPQLFDELYLFLKGMFGLKNEAVKAFYDPLVFPNQASAKNLLRDLKPAEAAPYTAFFLILIFARYKIFRESKIRNFFQESALIPTAANNQTKIIGDGRSVFNPERSVLEELNKNDLNGLVDAYDYNLNNCTHDIVMAEYIKHKIKDKEADNNFVKAQRHSNLTEVTNKLKQANKALGNLLSDGRQLIRVIESKESDKLQFWQAQTEGLMQDVIEQTQRLISTPKQHPEKELIYLRDRVSEEAKKLDRSFDKGKILLQHVDEILVIYDQETVGFERFRDQLDKFSDDVQRLLSSRPEIDADSSEPSEVDRFFSLYNDIRKLGNVAEQLSTTLEVATKEKSEQIMNLNWIDTYQEGLHGDKKRVFDWTFKTRQRDIAEQYAAIRERMILLMTTLVLASDHSARGRAVRFQKMGFNLKTTSASIPQFMLPATFAAVFISCLLISFSYFLFGDVYATASHFLFSTNFFQEQHSIDPNLNERIQITTPGRAAYWAFFGASMHMIAVFIALAAWSLSPEYHRNKRHENIPMRHYLGAWFTGLVFGFFANVVFYFVFGLIFNNPMLLSSNWHWTLLGSITGAFLLIQGLNSRLPTAKIARLTTLAQGIITGITAFIIAWIWGYGKIDPEKLGPFMLYTWLNMTIIGLVLGWLAQYFMINEDIGLREDKITPDKSPQYSDSLVFEDS